MTSALRSDIHMYPLYLKWASERFHAEKPEEGMRFFESIRDYPQDLARIVYEQLRKIQVLTGSNHTATRKIAVKIESVLAESILPESGKDTGVEKINDGIAVVQRTLSESGLSVGDFPISGSYLYSSLTTIKKSLKIIHKAFAEMVQSELDGSVIIRKSAIIDSALARIQTALAINRATAIKIVAMEIISDMQCTLCERELAEYYRVEEGEKAFHNRAPYSSSLLQRAEAIDLVLKNFNLEELRQLESLAKKVGVLEFVSTHSPKPVICQVFDIWSQDCLDDHPARQSIKFIWLLDGKKHVRLILIDPENTPARLKCLVIDETFKKIVAESFIDWRKYGPTASDAINLLKQCDTTLDKNNIPTFSRINPATHIWPKIYKCYEHGNDCEFMLIQQEDTHTLAWRVVDWKRNITSWINCPLEGRDDDFLDSCMHIKDLSPEESLSYTNETVMESAFEEDYRLAALSVYKIFRRIWNSQLDNRKQISNNRWAITLIDTGASEPSAPCTWGGHAVIAYEGGENGVRFLRYAHIIQDRNARTVTVKMHDEKTSHIAKRIRDQLPTAIRRADVVKKMVDIIKAKENIPVPFCLCPTLSFYNEKYNCLTWAIKHIRMCGIFLPEINPLLPNPKEYFTRNGGPLPVSFYFEAWLDKLMR